jgi:hypothetical protein
MIELSQSCQAVKFGIGSTEHSDSMTRELVHLFLYEVHTTLTDTLLLQI